MKKNISNKNCLLAVFIIIFGFYSSILRSEIQTSHKLETEWGINAYDVTTQRFELTLTSELETAIGKASELKVIPRIRATASDKLDPGESSQDERSRVSRRYYMNDYVEFELREFYFDTTIGKSYLTLGKQQVVWGTADGLRVLDVVNPFSFREFILEEFNASRIPLWMTNIQIPIDKYDIQLLWIPDKSYNDFSDEGDLYYLTSPRYVPPPQDGIDVQINDVDRPDRFWEDSDFGLRLTTTWSGWDLSLNYLYHYDDSPVLRRRVFSDSAGLHAVIMPEYERSHLYGATFSVANGDFVYRGELGYSRERYVLSDEPGESDGVTQRSDLSYVFGVDYSGLLNTFLSFQLFQSYISGSDQYLSRDKVDTTVSVLLNRSFVNETWRVETLWLHNTNDEDGLFRFKLRYNPNDSWIYSLSSDTLYGRRRGLFGQFSDSDQVVLGLIRYF